jgi:eukaryotic-like serine/threonine-protein kinase
MKQRPGTVFHEDERPSPPAKVAVLSAGDVVAGHYVIEERIDEGGMAVVYRATNSATGRACALKVLHAQLGDRAEFVELFAKEAKVSSVIGDSAHIVQVYDAGIDPERGIPFIVMELLEGETLERVLERGPLAPELAETLLEQLSSALDHAHEAGVVHRDLKPSNLFIIADRDGAPRLKVMDFGIAKVLEGEAIRTATHIGTPAYNAPEQMGATTRKLAAKQGIVIAAGVSPATDVWALGLIAYEMFTGDVPGRYWGVETIAELPLKVAFEDLEPASHRAGTNAPLLPSGFDVWFSRCLCKNAAERFPNAGLAIGELLALIHDDADVVTEDELEHVATRLASSPVLAADKARTRVRTESPPSSRRRSSAEPPPLPRISSPAITVAGASPALDGKDQKQAVSSAPPVVKTGGSARRPSPPPGGSRWGLAFAAGILLIGAAAAVTYQSEHRAGAAQACEKDGSDEQCRSACTAGKASSCAELATRAEKKGEIEAARGYLETACGVTSPADTAALRTWTRKIEAEGCPEDGCVASACVSLAHYHEGGRGGALDSARAATSLYKRACRVGMDDKPRGSEGCVGLGAQRERAGEIDAARNYYAAACEDGLADGCVALGHILERGNGEWKDEKRARELYEKACDGGELRGCTLLGNMVERGRGGWVKDEKAAVAHYKRACEGGQQLGCVHLADAHLAGRGGLIKDAVRAVELLTAACDANDATSMSACANLAAMVMTSQGGLARDEKRAFALNKKACDAAALKGCTQLAAMYDKGQAGLTKDLDEARALADRACRGGESAGCLQLAQLDAASGDTSEEELRALYDRACEGGEPRACVALALQLEKGDEAEQGRAAVLYTAACEAGRMRACTNLANLVYQGVGGLERDASRSVALNDKACEGGDLVGCTRLGMLHALGQGTDKDLAKARELHARACAEPPADEGAKRRCDMLAEYSAGDAEATD